jgi:hypothetical protein
MTAAPDYDTLNRLLEASALSPSPAEAQGIYCGLVAASPPDAAPDRLRERWLGELAPAAPRPAASADDHDADSPAPAEPPAPALSGARLEQVRTLLGDLADDTRAQLEGPAMGFELLLPDEGRSLRERASAAYEWTRGFLFGLGLAGLEPASLSAQGREAFDDLVEITRLDLDDLDDDETNEQALAEVIEFLRVAALLLHEEPTAVERSEP